MIQSIYLGRTDPGILETVGIVWYKSVWSSWRVRGVVGRACGVAAEEGGERVLLWKSVWSSCGGRRREVSFTEGCVE